MDDYQRLVVAQFFEPMPNLSQKSCHQFVLHHIAPILLPNATGKVDVQPSPFQGRMSYTAILHTHSRSADHRIAVQFRSDKQDLFGVNEASRIRGPIVPLVTYQGMCEGLFVYASPFAEGIPYISVLMSSEDFQLPLQRKMVTLMDLADLITRGAERPLLYSTLLYPTSLLLLREFVIRKLLPRLRDLAALPVTLTHQDLTPFNYLIDDSTGRVQAVLDWDGALYLPVGSNFHFMDSLFGFMTLSGWQDTEDRQELETAFYDRALTSLAAQGFGGITKEQLESQKAIGMLLYSVERLLKFKDERSEHYLDGYLGGLSLMNGFMFSH
ncbi:uncharacterized protein N7498_000800 [Penicillium cinerascens]|uniref:Aminoglycoside phosphotransferase domain-containing protein n=1 Tax=Penicillium cinerascens TaxID=70096 RepID=A0A9W9NF12_9EURO|nr:uncharacterized protein N7498_000800 [Penicillium cinerascens]KAJ5218701.1 hypothetical protein N7498_000800 [Penicillium cinerascens]